MGNTSNRIAESLKSLRSLNHLSQENFAKELNVSRSTLAMWETKKSLPSHEQITNIAEKFGVSVNYLYGPEKDQIEKFCNRVNVLMDEKSINRNRLFEKSRVSRETIDSICDRKLTRYPSPVDIENIAYALGTTYAYLETGDFSQKVLRENVTSSVYLNFASYLQEKNVPIDDMYRAAELVVKARENAINDDQNR